MIEFSALLELDQNLKLIQGNPRSVAGISSSLSPRKDTLIFIKGKKFLNELGRLGKEDNFGVVFDESFYNELSDTDLKAFSWIATSSHIAKSICLLSKPFYDLKFQDLNQHVDGRQMGTANVDPNAEIAQGVFIGEHAQIAEDVTIMPGCVVMPHAKVGAGTILYPNVTVYPYCEIGKNCRIHSGTVIGADGFGYNFIDGKHEKIWHTAGVVIEDDVEIGCGTAVDYGCFIETRIGKGTKIDNNVQISHNAQVGAHCIFCGKAGVAGSVEVEDYVVFASVSGAAPGARIGTGTQIGAAAVISENAIIPPRSVLAGHPARPLKEWLRSQAKLRSLLKE